MRPMPVETTAPEGELPAQDELPAWRRDRWPGPRGEIDPRMKGIWPPSPPPPPRRMPLVLLIPAVLVAMAFLLVAGLARLLWATVVDIAAEIRIWGRQGDRPG